MKLAYLAALAGIVATAFCPRALAGESGLYDPSQFGARGDGQTKDTAAIQAAIDAAAKAGGGTVRLTAGRYLCGTLHLRSHLTLRLESGAVLIESRDDHDFDPREVFPYDPHANKDTSCFHMALLAGEGIEDVAIEGRGLIEGNHSKRGGPKPIALKNCSQLTIRDITIANSPNYSISMIGSDHVNIEGVTIRNGYADGIDPDCCRYVRISNCAIDTFDDAICLKSSPALGAPHPTEYVTVTNCVLSTVCNFFKMGTESSGAFRRVALSNCVMTPRAGGLAPNRAGIAIEAVDGAEIDGVVVSNVTMEKVFCPIFVRLGNRGRGQKPPTPGSLRNVTISNIVASEARITSSVTGLQGYPACDVTLANVRISLAGKSDAPASLDVREAASDYPDPAMFATLPASALYVRHVDGLTLQDLRIERFEDARPLLVADDVSGLNVDGIQSRGTPFPGPMVWLNSTRQADLRNCGAGGVLASGLLRTTGACRDVRLFPPSKEKR